jgi:hypothetical protein
MDPAFSNWLTLKGFNPNVLTPQQLTSLEGAYQAEITPTVADAMADPQAVTIDGLTVQNRSIPDVIAADRHAAQAKASGPLRGVGLTQLRPGSARGE